MNADAHAAQWSRAVAAIGLSAAAFYLVRGDEPIWPFAWLAPIPILIVSFSASARRTALYAMLAYAIGSISFVQMAANAARLGDLVVFILIGSAIFSAAILVTRAAVRRWQHWSAVFVYPSLWTAWNFFLGQLGIAGMAHSQMDFVPVLQIAALTGAAGVTFLVSLGAAASAMAWHRRTQRDQARRALLIPLAICAAAIGWGAAITSKPPAGALVRVGLAATDETVRYFRTERADIALSVIAAYARRVGALAAQGAEVVVLPEKFVGVTPAYRDAVRDALADIARTHHVWLVAGLNLIEATQRRNIALTFAPDGRLTLAYDKVHMVPFWEDGYAPGRGPGPIPQTLWGVAICRDLNYGDIPRANVLAGVRLLLVPGWDFERDRWTAARIAVMRAVENGFAVVRSAQEGLVIAADEHGCVLDQQATGDGPEALRMVYVPLGSGPTLYARTGDWFAWLASAASLGIIIALAALRG